MPIQIYRKNQGPNDSLANAILQGTQGFVQGRQMRQQNEDKSLANAFMLAKIGELQRKTEAMSQAPEDPNYFRDPLSGKLYKRTGNQMGGVVPGNLTATKYDKYGNPKEYQDLNVKPLSGDTAGRFSMSEQGVGNAQKLENLFGFQEDSSGGVSAPGYMGKIIRAKMAGFNLPNINPFVGMVNSGVQALAGDEGKNIDLQYQTLAENLLRARTGAAATEPEIMREKQRLMGRITDSPSVAYNRIQEGKNLLGGTLNAMRPGYSKSSGLPTNKTNVPPWVPKGYEGDYQTALKRGATPEQIFEHLKKKGLA